MRRPHIPTTTATGPLAAGGRATGECEAFVGIDAAEARNAIAVAEGGRGLGFEVLEALADFVDRLEAALVEARRPWLARLLEAVRR